ncbi:MAG: SIMPL domain-containing protein [Treponema sp.]|nr:SIMPL domain-containing protein [Treponema sp.]
MKNLVKSILVIGLGTALFSSCVLGRTAKEDSSARSITVSGSGSISVKPDIISIKFLVKNTGWVCPQVVERNAINTTNTINAIKEAGIAEEDISTYDYSITQDNSHSYAGEYTICNTISVIIRNTELTGKVIDAAVRNGIGANGVTSFECIVSDKSTALREARTLAIKNAQDAASLLAGASGCKVKGVLEIREDYTSSGRGNPMVFRSNSTGGTQTPIIEGNVTITSNVTVKYELTN